MSLVQLPSQRELDLQRRVEATERQMAELRHELKALQHNPASQSQTAEGAQINLQVLCSHHFLTKQQAPLKSLELCVLPQEREQYGKLVELNKARGAQNALQVLRWFFLH